MTPSDDNFNVFSELEKLNLVKVPVEYSSTV